MSLPSIHLRFQGERLKLSCDRLPGAPPSNQRHPCGEHADPRCVREHVILKGGSCVRELLACAAAGTDPWTRSTVKLTEERAGIFVSSWLTAVDNSSGGSAASASFISCFCFDVFSTGLLAAAAGLHTATLKASSPGFPRGGAERSVGGGAEEGAGRAVGPQDESHRGQQRPCGPNRMFVFRMEAKTED